jgi:hypothetical protein
MKRIFCLIISSCAFLINYAQEDIFSDSIHSLNPEIIDFQHPIENSISLNDLPFSNKFLLIDPSVFNQPLLPDFSKNLNFNVNQSSSLTKFDFYSLGTSGIDYFLPYGTIFNQATYRINNRWMFGGNSFGSNSIFEAPKLNANMHDMSIKGASMFFQYKVSEKFKIQTRVEISNRTNPWVP